MQEQHYECVIMCVYLFMSLIVELVYQEMSGSAPQSTGNLILMW